MMDTMMLDKGWVHKPGWVPNNIDVPTNLDEFLDLLYSTLYYLKPFLASTNPDQGLGSSKNSHSILW